MSNRHRTVPVSWLSLFFLSFFYQLFFFSFSFFSFFSSSRIRSFYTWIASHIEYDIQAYITGNTGDQSAEKTFRTRLGVCAGYSNLFKVCSLFLCLFAVEFFLTLLPFQKMCKYANLHCENIIGHGKALSGLREKPTLSFREFFLFFVSSRSLTCHFSRRR